jgi:WD40 repeat protein
MRHGGWIERVAFSPDGQRVVTGSQDGTARVWDGNSGAAVTPPLRHKARVMSVGFSPDSRRVVTAARDSTARLWDAATGEPLSLPLKHEDWLISADFSGDGRRLLTVCENRTVRLWRLPQEDRPTADLVLLAELLSARRFDARGDLIPLEPADLRHAWQTLRDRYPQEFAPPGK